MNEGLYNLIRRRDRGGDNGHRIIRGVILHDIFENHVLDGDMENMGGVEVGTRFDLNSMARRDVKLNFRFEKEDIPRLLQALQIPAEVQTRVGCVASGTEALCILLRRLAYPNRLSDLVSLFGRSISALSEIFSFVNNYIAVNHNNLLDDLGHLPWLNQERMHMYSQAIANKGAAVQNCWAFIDGTARPICRPSENQEDYYSGHKRHHCIKYQSVLCPDGIIASLKGGFPGRRHDAGIFRESGLYEELERHARFPDGDRYIIFGDQAYGIRDLLLCPYPGRGITQAQQNFNLTMSSVRQAVEWGFQKIITEFAFLDFKKNQKLLLQDINSMYKTAVILTNCHTCLYSSQTAQYFNIEPVRLEDYFGI